MSRLGFLYIYPTRYALSFLYLWVHVFQRYKKVSSKHFKSCIFFVPFPASRVMVRHKVLLDIRAVALMYFNSFPFSISSHHRWEFLRVSPGLCTMHRFWHLLCVSHLLLSLSAVPSAFSHSSYIFVTFWLRMYNSKDYFYKVRLRVLHAFACGLKRGCEVGHWLLLLTSRVMDAWSQLVTFYCPSSISLSADNQWQWWGQASLKWYWVRDLGGLLRAFFSWLRPFFPKLHEWLSLMSSFLLLPTFVLEWSTSSWMPK